MEQMVLTMWACLAFWVIVIVGSILAVGYSIGKESEKKGKKDE